MSICWTGQLFETATVSTMRIVDGLTTELNVSE